MELTWEDISTFSHLMREEGFGDIKSPAKFIVHFLFLKVESDPPDVGKISFVSLRYSKIRQMVSTIQGKYYQGTERLLKGMERDGLIKKMGTDGYKLTEKGEIRAKYFYTMLLVEKELLKTKHKPS